MQVKMTAIRAAGDGQAHRDKHLRPFRKIRTSIIPNGPWYDGLGQ